MNREERVKAVLNHQEPDRIPVSVWMHLSQFDQDPVSLAEAMVAFNEKYDYDFIKMMPFGAYMIPDWGAKLDIFCTKYQEVEIADVAIKELEDYKKIKPLPAIYGTWGKQVQLAQHLSKMVKPHTPFIQTIFSPASTLKKMTSSRLIQDMKEHPEVVHEALEAITQTTIDFVKANIEAGVSGFFFATQTATYNIMDDVLFAEFCKPYDLRVMNAYKDVTYFNVAHIHGSNIMFDAISKYPCNCLNWHDRHTKPDMKEAREKCTLPFLGGIKEVPVVGEHGKLTYESILASGTPDQIKEHIKEAINMVGGKGILVGPGCVADPHTSEESLRAAREAVER